MSESTAGSRWIGRLGVALVVAGLALGAYVGWQVWGTDVVSQRTHRALVEQAEEAWSGGGAPAAATLETDHGLLSAIIRIPRFGDDYAVPLLEGTSDESLAAGFGRFTDAATPGDRGNFAVAAHRITYGEPLRDMPSLRPGDEVVVVTPRWTYTYVLDTGGDDLTVQATDGWVLEPLPRNPDDGGVQPSQEPGQRLITLTTCSDLFHSDGRLVAFGHLVARKPTTA